MKTLADLKREADTGKMYLQLINRFGSPDNVRGTQKELRRVVSVITVGIKLMDSTGKTSSLDLVSASLVEYDGITLKTFGPGLRPLNADEQSVMDEWNKICNTDEYKHQAEIDMISDGSTTFWQQKAFFSKAGYDYLFFADSKSSKHYDFNTKLIRDNKIRGDCELEYNVVFQRVVEMEATLERF